jgi:hypothetical protein
MSALKTLAEPTKVFQHTVQRRFGGNADASPEAEHLHRVAPFWLHCREFRNRPESQVQLSNIFVPALIALTLWRLFDFSTG